MSSSKSITKSASVIGSATLLSRILGFARDVITARFFGTGAVADAFFMAFSIPNLLRDLVGEGATNAAVVPVLTDELTKNGKDAFWKLAHALFNIFLLALFAVTVLGVVFAPAIVRVIAFGFKITPEKFNQTIVFARMLFPFIFFIGLAAYGMGVLNTLKHFSTPSLGPACLNAAMIICTIVLYKSIGIYGLILGVLIGGVLQFAIQMPALAKAGFLPFKDFGLYHPKIKTIARLMGPRAIGACIYQVNFIVSRMLASWQVVVGAGAVSALYYANRLFQFPLAIFAISMAQASLPTMSEHVANRDIEKLKTTLSFSLRNVFLVTLPATCGLIFLRYPIIRIFFQRGEFNAYSTFITSRALLCYLLGLFAVSGIKILVSCYYSLHDTRTPVKIAFVSLIINIIFSFILIAPLKVAGLALASTIAVIFNFAMLMIYLRKKIGAFDEIRLLVFFIKVSICAVITGALSYWLFSVMCPQTDGVSSAVSSLWLLAAISISTFAFFVMAKASGIEEVGRAYRQAGKITKWILRKK
ncbi:MAG: murein biosynthesis integral membrane protein MurJ [Candidatus Omnitrophota bacterium]